MLVFTKFGCLKLVILSLFGNEYIEINTTVEWKDDIKTIFCAIIK